MTALGHKTRCVYEFGSFRIDAAERQLLRDNQPVPLPPKVFDVLLVLVENSGHIVGKDELMKTVWSDTFVEEANLTVNISALRKVLTATSPEQQFIETIPKRGYRFIAPVSEPQDNIVDLTTRENTETRTIAEEDDETSSQAGVVPAFEQKSPPVSSGTRRKARWKLQLALGLLCVLAIGLAIALFYFRSAREAKQLETGAAGKPALKSIAVLPFKTLGSQDDEYLGIGITDALITQLGNIRQIAVRPTSAVRKYTDAGQDPLAAGHEQAVEVVLDGQLQRDGDRIRVTVQLIRVQDGASLWAAKFDDRFTNIFAVEDSISQQVLRQLPVELSDADQARLQKHGPENIEAYQLYLKGTYFWNKFTEDGTKKAIEYFHQAIEIDPNYALAYVGLSDAYNVQGAVGIVRPREAMPKAEWAAERAIALDDTLAEAHAAAAANKLLFDWDWAAAERELRRSLELNPNSAEAHDLYAYYFDVTGRLDEAMLEMKRAQELAPLTASINVDIALISYHMRRYDAAIGQYRKGSELDPDFIEVPFTLGQAYERKGMYTEAIAECQKAIAKHGRDPAIVSVLGYAYAMSGKRNEAQKIVAELTARWKQNYFPPTFVVLAYTGLGDKDQAFHWLDIAYAERDSQLIWVNVEPQFEPLSTDPRFAETVRRVGLPL